MNLKHRYKVSIDDESNLENKVKVSWKLHSYIICLIGLLSIVIIIAMALLAFSPLRNYLPGYLKESERAATEEQHLRLDSVLHIYDINEAYLDNMFNALDPVIDVNQEISDKKNTPLLSPDSLLPASLEEREFMEYIRERDKYNIASSVGLELETIMFEQPHTAAVITEGSKNSYTAEFILPHGAYVSAVAEGKVISIGTTPHTAGGYDIIIQHPKGFLSKCSRLGKPIIKQGDHVSTGQIISATTSESGRMRDKITLELWHNGDRLIPSRYLKIGEENSSNKKSSSPNNNRQKT